MTDREIEEKFTRKDIFDERTDAIRAETRANNERLEALMRETVARNNEALALHKAEVEHLRSEVRNWNARFESAFEAVNKRFDDMQDRLNRSFTVMSLIFAGVGFLFALPSLIEKLLPVIERLMKQ